MTEPTHLRSLQALELVIRTGSLQAAGKELNITPAAVGQRIKMLEDHLGVELLVRSRSGVHPAPGLEAALPHLVAAFREIGTAARILDFQRMHEVQIVADSDWADLWLKPRLHRFRESNPSTLFCINGVGDVPVRLGQPDCEIWFGETRGTSTESVLFRDYLVPVSSPENTARIAKQPPQEGLEGFPLLHLECYQDDPHALGWPEWIRRFGQRKTAPGRGIRYRRVVTALEAVYANAGQMICGLALVEADCAEGKLSMPFPISQGDWSGHAYHVSFRQTALKRAQTLQFRAWLIEEAQATEKHLRAMLAAG